MCLTLKTMESSVSPNEHDDSEWTKQFMVPEEGRLPREDSPFSPFSWCIVWKPNDEWSLLGSQWGDSGTGGGCSKPWQNAWLFSVTFMFNPYLHHPLGPQELLCPLWTPPKAHPMEEQFLPRRRFCPMPVWCYPLGRKDRLSSWMKTEQKSALIESVRL